jgi:hypothetical protein
MSSRLTPLSESRDTKLCRSSRGVQSAGSRPALRVMRRKARRTLAASLEDVSYERSPAFAAEGSLVLRKKGGEVVAVSVDLVDAGRVLAELRAKPADRAEKRA